MSEQNPYIDGSVTTLKVVLDCNKEEAWKLIATPEGVAKWFTPKGISNEPVAGEYVDLVWTDDFSEHKKVLDVKEGHYWEHEWLEGTKARYQIDDIDGKRLIFTLTVTYPEDGFYAEGQRSEATSWCYYLANLRSRSMGGPDLRQPDQAYSERDGFIL